MEAGSPVAVPTVPPPPAAAPAVDAAMTTNKTAAPVLTRHEPTVKRTFESVVPANIGGATTTEQPGLVDMAIQKGKSAFNHAANSINDFMGSLRPTSKIDCLNGGVPDRSGKECECKATWKGKRCEEMVCFNGGQMITLSDKTNVCRCYPEEFISGAHCDVITCQNGGMALADASGCDCTTIYTGKFCETNIFVTNAHIGIPALVLLIFLCCCFLCRMDLCPRRPPPGSAPSRAAPHSRRGHGRRQGQQQQHGLLRQHEQPPLLAQIHQLPAAATAASSSGGAYVIRLDTIPTFNPQMIGGVPIEEGKILEPPPPYDEALNARCNIEPPRYQELPPEGSQVRAMEEGGGGRRNAQR